MKTVFLKSLMASLVVTTASFAQDTQKPEADVYQQLERFGAVLDEIQRDYVEEVDTKELIDAAISGMLTSLDPHSSYLNEEDFQDMQETTTGEFAGLGIEVTQEEGFVKVVSPIDDSPATEAGLLAGDYITHVDGETLLGLSLDESVNKLKGPIGTTVKITVVREGEKEPFDVDITRDVIKAKSAKVRAEGNIAVIRMAQFNEQSYPNMADGLKDVAEELGGEEKIEGYVLDLRNNPGGLLVTAIQVSDAFLEEGEIVSTRGRNENDSSRANATKGDLANGKPVVVLINGGSASASEIVAGALKDQHRAVIIGTPSFGKGSVQTIIPFEKTSALRMTTARYYTPSGRSIQGFGVEPDIYIEALPRVLETDEPKSESFQRQQEGDLRGAISNDSLTDEEIKILEAERIEREEQTKIRETDIQLSYALDMIHGMSVFEDDK